MLSVSTPFPQSGAGAFVRKGAFEDIPAGTPCRILQRQRDGQVSVSFTGSSRDRPDLDRNASGNRTLPVKKLAATQEEALGIAKPKRRRARAKQ